MKLFLCAAAALTLSVSAMNAQEKADVIRADKTQVTKKASKTQSVEMKKAAKETNKSSKAVKNEDAKSVKSDYVAPKKKAVRKDTKKTDAQLTEEKKAKKKNKSIDH